MNNPSHLDGVVPQESYKNPPHTSLASRVYSQFCPIQAGLPKPGLHERDFLGRLPLHRAAESGKTGSGPREDGRAPHV